MIFRGAVRLYKKENAQKPKDFCAVFYGVYWRSAFSERRFARRIRSLEDEAGRRGVWTDFSLHCVEFVLI